MKRNTLVLALGLLALGLLGWNLTVSPSALPPAEAAAPSPAYAVSTSKVLSGDPLTQGDAPTLIAQDSPLDDPLALAQAEEQLLIDLYERVSPSVVHIAVTGSGPNSGGSGSGFVFDVQGHIVTNNHVVEGAERILVRFADDTTVEAELVGHDADSDLAVIRVDVPARQLRPVELGDSEALRVGQRAIAVGNPFGLEQTMTTGIVSALGRVVRQESGFSLPQLVQTDAAINPGNSGGPLLDSQGRVIGVTTLIFSESGSNAGVGFAVPVNTVARVVPSLIATGRYADPWLGITGATITALLAESLDLPVEQGVLVQEVVPGGPAEKAGLRGSDQQEEFEGTPLAAGGDIIVAIGGVAVQDMDDLIVYLADTGVGQTVTLTVLRDGEEQSVDVVLEERPTR
jgi:S1-C subfamily serine protease